MGDGILVGLGTLGCFAVSFLIWMACQPKILEEGTSICKCISKYNSQTSGSYGYFEQGTGRQMGRTYNNYFVTLEDEKGVRITYSISTADYGKIREGETVEVSWTKYSNEKYFIKNVIRAINS